MVMVKVLPGALIEPEPDKVSALILVSPERTLTLSTVITLISIVDPANF